MRLEETARTATFSVLMVRKRPSSFLQKDGSKTLIRDLKRFTSAVFKASVFLPEVFAFCYGFHSVERKYALSLAHNASMHYDNTLVGNEICTTSLSRLGKAWRHTRAFMFAEYGFVLLMLTK